MKSGIKYTFERIEKKYVLTRKQYLLFLEKAKEYIKIDDYGLTSICNIYFDTLDSELIRTSIEKPLYKEKLRLRSYGIPKDESSKVFLELKKKFDGVVYKRRVAMTLKEANEYLENHVFPNKDTQILHEIDYAIDHYHLVPKLFLAYDRAAYYGIEDEELRITFDKNIRSRETQLSLMFGDDGKKLLDDALLVMEIKANGAMPLWLTELLTSLEIYPKSFSKYGNIYKKGLLEKPLCNENVIEYANENIDEENENFYINRRKNKCLQVY